MLTLTLGFAQSTRPTSPATQGPIPHLLGGMQGRPAASDIVFLQGGDPAFVVPQGRYLVITGLGSRVNNNSVRLLVEGVPYDFKCSGTKTIHDLTAGWSLPAGTTVEVVEVANLAINGLLSGYLEDA